MKNIKFIEVKSEIGAGTRGASLGIDALQVAALDFMSSLFVNIPSQQVETVNHLLYEPVRSPFAKRINGVATMYERVADAVCQTMKEGGFPLVLAGDHSTAGGTMAGIKMAHPNARIGVVWVDAHADIHTPYTTPSGNVHGMPVASAIGEDNKALQSHELDEETIECWEKMKNIGGICPKVLPEDIVYIGLRDFEKEEEALIKQKKIKIITVEEIREKGVEYNIKEVLKYLTKCDYLYVSFDVDSMDPSVSKGTGTPVPNGLKKREAEDIIASFSQNHKLCCLEFTEINPTLDSENMMAETAFNILQRAVNLLMIN